MKIIPKTLAAKAYYKRVAWTLNGNIPGMRETVRLEVERLNGERYE
jgi:hypothetical protein